MKRSRSLFVEPLEDRCTPATFSNPWPDPQQLTLSFAPDATAIGGNQSGLFGLLNSQVSANSAVWKKEILRAFQTWAVHANINIGVVPDGGQPIGSPGVIQGDTRFGDIRVGAYPVVSSELAFVEPFDAAAGTWSGDLMFSSGVNYTPGKPGAFDLYSVALHEAGHVFGLGHSENLASPLYETYQGPRMGLCAEDIARLQAIYGTRTPDAHEGSNGNDSFSKATPVLVLDGVPVPLLTGDVTTPSDQDYFKFYLGPSLSPYTIHLQTEGVSALTARLSVYDHAQRLVDSVFATDPLNGDLAIKVKPGLLGGTYYVRVNSAADDVFGVGSYRLAAVPGSLSLSSVVGAASGLLNVDNHTNDTLGAATSLTQIVAQTDRRFDYVYKASIHDAKDVDYYQLRSPTPPAGKNNVMTVMAWGLQADGLDPLVAVYDAAGKAVPATVLSHENSTYVIQVANTQANAVYHVSVRAHDPDGTNAKGNYLLGIDFTTVTTNLMKFVDNTPATQGATPSQPNFSLNATRELLFHFVLSADKAGAPAGAAVQLNVYDPAGRLVTTVVADAGESQSLTLFLSKGLYKFQFTSINRNGGTVVPLAYKLGGLVLNDPVKPYQDDPTEEPSSPPPPPSNDGTNTSNSSPSPSSSPDGSYSSWMW